MIFVRLSIDVCGFAAAFRESRMVNYCGFGSSAGAITALFLFGGRRRRYGVLWPPRRFERKP